MPKIIYGTPASDGLWGSKLDDWIWGGDGHDKIMGDDGNDILFGEGGNDSLRGADGDDILYGGAGLDFLDGWNGNDTLFGGSGDDLLRGGAGADDMDGGTGIDTVSYDISQSGVSVSLLTGYAAGGHATGDTLTGFENIEGSLYADNLSGDHGANNIDGNGGDDLIFGFGGNDELDGGIGDDTLYGGDGDDELKGFFDNDTLYGNGGNDVLNGGTDDDMLFGGDGNDRLVGLTGADHLDGGAGIDTADYSSNFDPVTIDLSIALVSGGWADGDVLTSIENLVGSQYDDKLSGDGANNRLDGGLGMDVLKGNAGADTFFFLSSQTGIGRDADRIMDFNQTEGDKIGLLDLNFFLPNDLDFIGSAAFTGQNGEVRFEQSGTNTWVHTDIDGDAVSDFDVLCVGLINFTANDFIL